MSISDCSLADEGYYAPCLKKIRINLSKSITIWGYFYSLKLMRGYNLAGTWLESIAVAWLHDSGIMRNWCVNYNVYIITVYFCVGYTIIIIIIWRTLLIPYMWTKGILFQLKVPFKPASYQISVLLCFRSFATWEHIS